MTEQQINEVVLLSRAGNAPREIAQMIGRSYTSVLTAQAQARERGLLPAKTKPPPRQVARNYVSNNGMALGRVSDVVMALSRGQRAWLLGQTQKLGCATIAEYLTELVREEHAEPRGSIKRHLPGRRAMTTANITQNIKERKR